MNSNQKITPIITDDSQLETEFICAIEFGEWSIMVKFRFHSTARCVRITAAIGNTERCVNLRADRSEATSVSFNTAHLLLTDNQIPWAYGPDFKALQYGIAIADWISRFLCLTAEKSAAEAQAGIEAMCLELSKRLSNGGNRFGPCL